MKNSCICLLLLCYHIGLGQKIFFPKNTKIGIYTDFKGKTAPAVDTIRFDKEGKIIEGYPLLLKEKDIVVLEVLDEDPMNTDLRKKIDNYRTKIQSADYLQLIKKTPLLGDIFNGHSGFLEYKSNLGSFLPAQDAAIVYELEIEWVFQKSSNKPPRIKMTCASGKCGSGSLPVPEKALEMRFRLIKQHIDNQLYKSYLEQTVKKLDDNRIDLPDWEAYRLGYEKWYAMVAAIRAAADTAAASQKLHDDLSYTDFPINQQLCEQLSQVMTKLPMLKEFVQEKVVQQNRDWIKHWLWLTSLENPSIHPSGWRPVSPFELQLADERIVALTEEVDLQKELIKKRGLPTQADPVFTEAVGKLNQWSEQLVQAKNFKTALLKFKSDFEDWQKKISVESELKYAGRVFISNSERIVWMPQFDASDEFRPKNSFTLADEKAPYIAERDIVKPLTLNVKRGQKSFFKDSVINMPLVTPIASAFDAWGKAFDDLKKQAIGLDAKGLEVLFSQKVQTLTAKSLGTGFRPLGDFSEIIADFEKMVAASGTNPEADDLKAVLEELNALFTARGVLTIKEIEYLEKKATRSKTKLFLSALKEKIARFDPCESFDDHLKEYREAEKYFDWFARQNFNLPEIKLKAITDTLLHSDWGEGQNGAGKKGIQQIFYSVSINDGKKTTRLVSGQEYKQYELPRFAASMGVTYITRPRYASVFTNGAFEDLPQPEQIDIVAGVKWYPFKGMNQTRTPARAKLTNLGGRYQYLRGNAFVNRISVFTGLGLRYKFLRSYFLGVGVDVFPGFNLHTGINFYIQNRYDIVNGKTEKSYEHFVSKPPCYFALTLDVSVFTRIVTLLNPF